MITTLSIIIWKPKDWWKCKCFFVLEMKSQNKKMEIKFFHLSQLNVCLAFNNALIKL